MSAPCLPQGDDIIIIVDEDGVAREERRPGRNEKDSKKRSWTDYLWLIPVLTILARLVTLIDKDIEEWIYLTGRSIVRSL